MSSYLANPLPDWLKADFPANGAADTLVLFSHGAGADMDSDFMVSMAARLCDQGFVVVRFNFPYMQQRRLDGSRRPPNRTPALLSCFNEAIDLVLAQFAPKRLFLMGKSMGGRMAAILGGDEGLVAKVSGVVCLGYPFLPPKGNVVRLEPLQQCKLPLLIVQGERDSFGTKAQVVQWELPSALNLHWLADGDHSLVPRKSSGYTEAGNLNEAAEVCARFMS